MRKLEIESWALRIIERVETRQPIEDFLVELKGEWPADSNKAARRIAGHANASRGEPILWLIGVDENVGVIGAQHEEMADWWARVKSEFDGVAPSVRPLNISWKGKTVTALLFEVDRIPFVVKNPSYGKTGGGPVALEVPWREGNSTKSASRSDLILLLSPLQRAPRIELLNCRLTASERQHASEDPIHQHWELDLALYVYPRSNSPVVIPAHRCEATFEIPNCVEKTGFFYIRFLVYGRGLGFSSETEGIVDGPGALNLRAEVDLLPPREINPVDAKFTIKLLPADVDQSIVIGEILKHGHTERGVGGWWRLIRHPSLDRLGPYLKHEPPA